MKRPILILALSFVCLSCKKEIIEVDVINPAPAPVQLTIEQVVNDSTIVLKWTPFSGNFQKIPAGTQCHLLEKWPVGKLC